MGQQSLALKERFNIDEFEFMDYVHDIDLTDHLTKNIALRNLISAYPQRKFIFTNADTNHVNRILKFLDLEDLFVAIIDIHTMMPHLKPHRKAFDKALEIARLTSWDGCAYLDDHPANIAQARNLGIYSILIDESSQHQDELSITSLFELPKLISSIRLRKIYAAKSDQKPSNYFADCRDFVRIFNGLYFRKFSWVFPGS